MKDKRTYLIAITVNNRQWLPDQETKVRSDSVLAVLGIWLS
jgi:hypothetical protein